MSVEIRKATVDDARSVAAVMNAVIGEGKYTIFDKPFSDDEERAFIASLGSRSALYVAELDGEIVGVQAIDRFFEFHNDSVQHVATIGTWLRADARGRGIGKLLSKESLGFAREHGYLKIVIHVLADNEDALRFYRSLGFQDIGVARNHVKLSGAFHDEIYLEMSLV
jgi:RimJ/RimL family protein N-acetyltransferase